MKKEGNGSLSIIIFIVIAIAVFKCGRSYDKSMKEVRKDPRYQERIKQERNTQEINRTNTGVQLHSSVVLLHVASFQAHDGAGCLPQHFSLLLYFAQLPPQLAISMIKY